MSRSALIGALYGAMHEGGPVADGECERGVPSSWVALLNDGEKVLAAARRLADLRQHSQLQG